MQRLIVVGGGIGGLAAAWAAWTRLEERGATGRCEVVLLEAAAEPGGKAQSAARDGWLVERGPTGFLSGEPAVDRLIDLAGLEAVPARAAAARRFVYVAPRLRELKPHPLQFATSGVLSPLGFARLACEPFVPKRTDPEDESIWEFARRRIGRQAADRLIAPMTLGVFAGDAKKLSLACAFPRMAELEAEHGSLIRAMIALKKARKLKGGPAGPAGTLTSFAGGLQALPRALAARAPFRVRTGAPAAALAPAAGARGWRVTVAGDGEPTPADAVVVACDLDAARGLLAAPAPEVAGVLDQIACPSVAVVALGYGAEALGKVPRGFGALIPRGAGYRALGVLWDTHLFDGRSPAGKLLMRAMIGGATDPDGAALSEEQLAATAHEELARLFGLTEGPVFRDVTRWPRAIPQYELGHAHRVEAVELALEALRARRPGLVLTGNYLCGVAFPKAAAQGWAAGERAAEALLHPVGV